MFTTFATWIIARRIFGWHFPLIIAMAWTWTTNVVTIIPCYYLFYITGQLILGSGDIAGYEGFADAWKGAFADHLAWYESIIVGFQIAFDFGLDLVVGSIPYIIAVTWFAYSWSKKFMINYRKNRSKRWAKKREQRRLRREKREAKANPAQG